MEISKKDTYTGFGLAILATFIWSGNYIIARGIHQQIGPVSLNFFRWFIASIVIFPLGLKKFKMERKIIAANRSYIFWVAVTGISLFNTLIYIAGHHTSAINMALIGTTSAPIFVIILSAIFLREKNNALRIIGLLFCIAGILFLLSGGSIQQLMNFHFSTGDLWMLLAGFLFAVYSILVKIKPNGISALSFLFVTIILGTLLLFPLFLIEYNSMTISWNWRLVTIIAFLGIGPSVISYFCWNLAIQKLGASRTTLFSNLIPIFSAWEAVIFLSEKITALQIISGLIVILGLIIANSKKANMPPTVK